LAAKPKIGKTEGRRALVLHDTPLVVDLIELTLNHGVFQVHAARDLAGAEEILTEWGPDLAVVDMDHEDSAALLERMGSRNRMIQRTTPAIGLTRRGDLKTKLEAFELGVDDILTMPFSPEELLARAIVVTRRVAGTKLPIIPAIRIGDVEIDIMTRDVRAGESVIHLTSIEQSLLYLLASRGGQVVTRDEILDAIWGTDFVAESNIVDRHVRSLRASSRMTTAARALSPLSRRAGTASSRPSRTRAGTAQPPRRTRGRTDAQRSCPAGRPEWALLRNDEPVMTNPS